ncbi:hypothetical protein DPMN_116798 [Dreissena polymorpha]|uniref:Uncharacterized protein n=1 Tax=Dreissena polymorpha TaxID=45954 RepID=A0A9D4QV29_DREPO|nr:hypothetical protein DPMN_116798 [Dreissena polymorpha]
MELKPSHLCFMSDAGYHNQRKCIYDNHRHRYHGNLYLLERVRADVSGDVDVSSDRKLGPPKSDMCLSDPSTYLQRLFRRLS